MPAEFRASATRDSEPGKAEGSVGSSRRRGGSFHKVLEGSRLANSFWFRPRDFERRNNGEIFRKLGTHHFLEFVAPRDTRRSRSQAGTFSRLLNFGFLNEVLSLTAFAAGSIGTGVGLATGDLKATALGFIAAVAIGGYPFLGARYQRARLFNIASRSRERQSRKNR